MLKNDGVHMNCILRDSCYSYNKLCRNYRSVFWFKNSTN